MRVTICLAGLLLLAGCAPLSEQQYEGREYRNEDWRNRFLDYKRRCIRSGGYMLVQASSRTSRDGIPRPGTYYTCSNGLSKRSR